MSKGISAFALAVLLVNGVATRSLSAQARSTMPVAEEFERLHFRSIGPAVNSGRIADLAVYEANPAIYYVGSAHGGVWKTTSKGLLFTPLLQDKGLLSIGAVAVSQTNPDLVWVGTGEANNRQSTSWGDGIYKSTDGGTTFQHMGLARSQHINRIVIDPANNDVVLVAAPGPLFGPGGDRGIFKTTDGGKTWKQVLKGDDDTGANELVMAHANPKLMFASTYQRRRTACCMNGGGPGSAVWKSIDGGDTWTKVAGGLPSGSLGRIGLDIYRDNANIVYALIEGPGGGGRGGRGAAPEEAAYGHGRLSLRRRRHDVAEDEQRESAPDVLQSDSHRSRRIPDVSSWAASVCTCRSTAARPSRQMPIRSFTATITRSGSIRTTRTTSSSATTAASPSRTTGARPGHSFPIFPSVCSTMSATTWRSRSTSAAACRTTTTGAARACHATRTAS